MAREQPQQNPLSNSQTSSLLEHSVTNPPNHIIAHLIPLMPSPVPPICCYLLFLHSFSINKILPPLAHHIHASPSPVGGLFKNELSSSRLKSPCITTLSSSSLCILASRNRQCTPHRKPDVKSVIQKMCDKSQISTITDMPDIPIEACFWVMVIPFFCSFALRPIVWWGVNPFNGGGI